MAPWRHYGEKKLAPLRRKYAGAITSENQWLLYAENKMAPLRRKMTEVINFLRQGYAESGTVPNIRLMQKAMTREYGPEKGNSKYLYELFPYGPAKQGCRIAGLPKPTGCV